MSGAPINALNNGLQIFRDALSQDALASVRVEVAVVTFSSSIKVDQPFVGAYEFEPPRLFASGSTSMGAGIIKALDIVRERKHVYRITGASYYRPWIFMLTDGGPTDSVDEATRRLHAAESSKGVSFFAVGVEGANMATLKAISPPSKTPLKLHGLNFAEMFQWLSDSMSAISQSQPGDQVALAPPGWGYMTA